MKKEEIIERYGIEEYERQLQANRERNRGNPQYKAHKSKWQKENRDKVNAWNREQRRKNICRYRNYQKEWEKKNPQKARALNLVNTYNCSDRRRGYDTKNNVTYIWIMENIFTSSCFYCGDSDWEHLGCDRIDNTKPHTPDNCVCACGICNIERNDRCTVEEFKQYRETHPRGISLIGTLKPKIVKENGKTILRKV